VPKTSIRYDFVHWILPLVGPCSSMMVTLSSVATIQPWYHFSFSTEPSLAVRWFQALFGTLGAIWDMDL
jgi:hypothetical protein